MASPSSGPDQTFKEPAASVTSTPPSSISRRACISASLCEGATGAKIPAVKIFLGPRKEGESPQPIYLSYTQYHPPETGATRLWLINRQPHRLRERKEVEHLGTLEAATRVVHGTGRVAPADNGRSAAA